LRGLAYFVRLETSGHDINVSIQCLTMRLCKFEVCNFKGIQRASFEWESIVVLIGENNAGKSSVLQALQCFLGGSQIKDENFFCNKLIDPNHAIELVGHFSELSETEQNSPFWCETDGTGASSWKEQYFSLSRREVITGWPENDSTWANFPGEYHGLINQIPGGGARPNTQTRDQLRELLSIA
jgi:putative ATP-dependent endonuclease of OLD family